ncbi:MAG: hypothetical protein EBU46_14760 [Nitrosomonadaceae bacterium]|nr:hypothetical protein [Nitrosomonadaceae bacterium]
MSRSVKKVIHVDQHAIKRNNKRSSGFEPAISVKTYKSNIKAMTAHVFGPSSIVYSPVHPLSCGARCWIETKSDVLCRVPGKSGRLESVTV